jgi:biopolymer transport protein ExbD
MRIRNTEHRETVVLQMTPMIDIVFQLLVFFVFTFKIVLPEGDFNIRMPSSAASPTSAPSETPLLHVQLRAAPNGELAGVQLGDLAFSGEAPFRQLHETIRGMIHDAPGPGATDQEVEIEADYQLHYRYAMHAITAITGEIDDNGEQHKLVERVRFAPLSAAP